MSLTIFGALLMAGLVVQSCAFAIRSPQQDGPNLPGFSFSNTTADNKQLSMYTTEEGKFFWETFGVPEGPQNFTSDENGNTISTFIRLPLLGVYYRNTVARVDKDSVNNLSVISFLGASPYLLKVTTTKKSGEKCGIKVEIVMPALGAQPIIDSNSKVVQAFETDEMKHGLSVAIWKNVKGKLQKILTKYFTKLLTNDSLCEQMTTATKTNYPKLQLNAF